MADGSDDLEGVPPPAAQTALFGHDEAGGFLARAYRSGRIHHAVLMEGPEGIGKATLAFHFAHHVLSFPDPETAPETLIAPDPQSALFRQIATGASHHLLHLTRPVDEKTGRARQAITVEEVRRAGRFLAQTSGTGNWRIVVIDPADDFNRSAANAILKILEEPPRRALFLVVSHAPGRLLPTIRSRCLPLRLSPLDAPAMHQALDHLGLSGQAGADATAEVVRRSQGSVRRAVLLLNYGGLDIAEAFDAIVSKGVSDARGDIYQLADALTARDREAAYGFFRALVGDWLALRAGAAARAGDLRAANRLANLSATLEETWATAGAYNLDRKQTVLGVFSSLAEAGAA